MDTIEFPTQRGNLLAVKGDRNEVAIYINKYYLMTFKLKSGQEMTINNIKEAIIIYGLIKGI